MKTLYKGLVAFVGCLVLIPFFIRDGIVTFCLDVSEFIDAFLLEDDAE